MDIHPILALVIVISTLVTIHEFGHYIVAKICGVHVHEFSLGFGKRLLQKRFRTTNFCLRLIPLGGYVRLADVEESETEYASADVPIEKMMSSKSVFARMCIVSAGVVANLITAVVLITGLGYFGPAERTEVLPIVVETLENSPAELAGFQPGDRITHVNGKELVDFAVSGLFLQDSNGDSQQYSILRNGEPLQLFVTPDPYEDTYRIGVAFETNIIAARKLSFVDSIQFGVRTTALLSKEIVNSLIGMVKNPAKSEDLGGPIKIAQIASQQTKQGAVAVITFLAIMSINLAIFNLLPIPILDGGALLFLAYEGIMRKPMNEKAQLLFYNLGALCMFALIGFTLFNDIRNVFA